MLKLKKAIFLLFSLLFLFPNLAVADQESDQTASVTVPAQASDYQLEFERLTPGSQFTQDDEVEYQVKYGAHLSFNTTVTVEAEWYPGILDSDNSSVDILDYVPGSATNGYGGAAPVVDTVNRKVDWTFNSFPGNTTDQTVTFKLKLNSNYTGTSNVTFKVAGRLYAPGVVTPDESDTANFLYTPVNSGGGGSGGSSSGGGSGSGGGTSPQPQPTNSIEKVEVRTITESSAQIFVSTSQKSKINLAYGKSISSLNTSVKSTSFANSTLINLSGLSANTKYYFRLIATDENGKQTPSDLYTFKTAKSEPSASVDENSLIATSNDTIVSLINGGVAQIQNNYLIIPVSTVFQLKFSVKNRETIKKIQAIVRNKQTNDMSVQTVELIEVEPGAYSSKLKTSDVIGKYEIFARIYDTKGNITEQKIADLKVINKFTVLSKKDSKPIEGARVHLYIYSSSTKKYVIIPSDAISYGNPVFTDANGELSIVLPQGKYKADISDLKFKDQTVEFAISPKDKDTFPIVYMESEGLNLLKLINYNGRSINDVFIYNTRLYAKALTGSSRFFDLLSGITLGSLALSALFSFSRKHRIPFLGLVSHFYYLIDHNKRNEKYIHGVVYDKKNSPIPGANVYLSEMDNEEIIARAKTNSKGEFFFRKGNKKYVLLVMARGYKPTPLISYEEKNNLKFKISLQKDDSISNVVDRVEDAFSHVLGMSFEIILVLSLVFELLFLNSFGLMRTLPFLAISIFNLALWLMHSRHSTVQEI